MRWVQKGLIVFVVLALLLPTALAPEQSNLKIEPIKDRITPQEAAFFDLTITNTQEQTQRYSLFSFQLGQGWNVDPMPLKDRIIELAPGATYKTTIRAQPLEEFEPGIYHVDINVESDLGESHILRFKIFMKPTVPLQYPPSIEAQLDMNEKIDPTKTQSLKLFIENRNPLDLDNLTISLQSDIPEFEKQSTISLPGLEKKTLEFTITPDPFTQPKNYAFFVVFEYEGKTIEVIDTRIEITQLLPQFTQEQSFESSFLRSSSSVVITNPGNVKNTQEVRVPLGSFQSLFTKAANAQKVSDDQGSALVYSVELSPNQQTTVSYHTSYRSLLYVFIALLVFVIFYLYVRSPIVIRKSAITTKSSEHGALSEIKITLEVHNKSSKPLKNIKITDMVPAIANVEKSLELGTLKPHKVKHATSGTTVVWALAEIDGDEHRLITYKVKAKLNILGTFSLPRAVVEYGKGKNKTRKAYSNQFKLDS